MRPGSPILRARRSAPLLFTTLVALATIAPSAARAAVTIGSPLNPASTSTASCGAGTFFDSAVATGTATAPFDGVVVRWRIYMPAGGGGAYQYKLRILRPQSGGKYLGAGTGPGQTAPASGVNVLTRPTPLPITSGDLIGDDCAAGAPTLAPASGPPPAGTHSSYFSSPLADGASAVPAGTIPGDEEFVNADVVGYAAVSGVSPSSGTAAGGDTVTISGTHLTDVTGVSFGGVSAASFTVVSDSQITATAPAHTAGTADVTVTNAAGTSATTTADQFAYQPLPVAPTPPATPLPAPAPTPTPTLAPSNAFTVVRSSHRGARLVVVLRAPGAGSFSLEGVAAQPGGRRAKRLFVYGSATASVAAAGNITLTVRPGATAKRLLRSGRPLRVSLRIYFTPRGGRAALRSVRFRIVPGGGRRTSACAKCSRSR